jgi:hypothetical protein
MKLPVRELRGLGLVALGNKVRRLDDEHFVVTSSSGLGSYEVTWEGSRWACGCADFAERGAPCKHIFGVHWGSLLPFVLMSNSEITWGPSSEVRGARLTYCGRAVYVRDLVDVYKTALARLRTIDEVRLIRPPPPKLTLGGLSDLLDKEKG